MPIESDTRRLFIRSARPRLLRISLAVWGRQGAAILTAPAAGLPEGVEIFEAPAGPLSWEQLSPAVQKALADHGWDEIYILHGGQGDYGAIFRMVARISDRARIIIIHTDLSSETFASAADLPDPYVHDGPLEGAHADARLPLAVEIAGCLARGAATSAARRIDACHPISWEFSGFSQNGEDGIIDYLSRRLAHPNRYFVEIGAGDGIENNSSWLARARRFSGLMIEGRRDLARTARQIEPVGTDVLNWFVAVENIHALGELSLFPNPDVFSLDIDGNDYHIARAMLEYGFRPKICVVEYNATFGPDAALSIPYQMNFDVRRDDASGLHFGVSIAGWKRLFERHGYCFVTVDSNGVNAVFVDPAELVDTNVGDFRGLSFAENFYQLQVHREGFQERFERIRHLPLQSIE